MKELNEVELMEVDGGGPYIIGLVTGTVAAAAVILYDKAMEARAKRKEEKQWQSYYSNTSVC